MFSKSYDTQVSDTGPSWSSCYYHYILYKKNPVINAKIVDPDQMLRSTASDLGLHCLQMSYMER